MPSCQVLARLTSVTDQNTPWIVLVAIYISHCHDGCVASGQAHQWIRDGCWIAFTGVCRLGAGDARGAEERPGPTSLSGRALVQMRRGSAVAAPKFICHRTLHPPPPYPSETLAYLVGGGSSGDGGGGTAPSVQESPPCSAPGPQRTGQTRPVPPVLLSFLILLSPLWSWA
jgi:hypothetical protein